MLNKFVIIKSCLPIATWLPNYNLGLGLPDFIGGITIGLTLIPQSLAYAALAGLSPEYGLYSSLVGGFLYAIFGTIPELSIAPTAILSLLTFSYTHNSSYGSVPAAVLLCFLSGIVELICGILHLGFLVDFVSAPVVAGFTSAGAITIACAQVKNLLGLKFNAETFIDVWKNVFKHIHETRYEDAVLGSVCCFTLFSLRFLKNFGLPPTSDRKTVESESNKAFKIFIWFLSVSRNAIVVIVTASISFQLHRHGKYPFSLTTEVPSGLPPIELPKFTISNDNHTYTFLEMVSEVGSGVIVVPFVAILGNVAIAKSFAQGKVVNATQEMIAVGICSIVGSFLGSMPVNASFSRGAVSNASGVKTSFAGIYSGILVILALTFLTPYFHYIPKATLAAVIICAVMFMVEVSVIKPIWKINKIDWIPLWTTFVACLVVGIEIGILIGVVVDIILVLYYNARPAVIVEKITKNNLDYMKVTPSASLLFPSAEYIRELIMKSQIGYGKNIKLIVLDCGRISRTDYTTAKCMAALINDFQNDGKQLIFLKIEPKLANTITGACGIKCPIIDNEEDIINYDDNLSNTTLSIDNLKNTNANGKDCTTPL